jgi:hypothetical protein
MDHIGKPDMISPRVIERVMDDPLVIADLTARDPIVYYLLAVRHMTRKAIVKLINRDQKIPFDVAHSNTIRLDVRDLDSVEAARRELRTQIRAVEKKPVDLENPITNFVDIMSLRQSADPAKDHLANLYEVVREIQTNLEAVLQGVRNLDSAYLAAEEESASKDDASKRVEGSDNAANGPESVDVARISALLSAAASQITKK